MMHNKHKQIWVFFQICANSDTLKIYEDYEHPKPIQILPKWYFTTNYKPHFPQINE